MGRLSTNGLIAALAIAVSILLAGIAPAAAAMGCDATLYADADFAGTSERLTQDQPSLLPDISGQASSLRIAAGRWTFFSEPGYGGASLPYGPGVYPRVPAGWNDRIASARCVSADDAPAAAAGSAGPASPVADPGASSDGAIAPAAASAAGSPPLVGGTPYFSGGQPYGWYDGGWNGAGFYVVGTQSYRGHGFGGRDGWHGWRRPFWYRYHYRFDGHGRAVQPIHFPGGQGGRRLEGGRGGGRQGAGLRCRRLQDPRRRAVPLRPADAPRRASPRGGRRRPSGWRRGPPGRRRAASARRRRPGEDLTAGAFPDEVEPAHVTERVQGLCPRQRRLHQHRSDGVPMSAGLPR